MTHPQPGENPPAKPLSGAFDRALALVEFLRLNCAWDAAQTPLSLRRYLLEEAHEVIGAIEAEDLDALREELGDLLLNVAFQVVLAEEARAFDREGVVQTLEAKMRRRHPHLFGGEAESWERIKARERGDTEEGGILAKLVAGPDALAHAHKIQSTVSEVGFDWAEPAGA